MKLYHKLLAFLLRFTKPGYLDESLFNQMQRINHCVSVELLIMEDKKVWLEQRVDNDRYWPSQWHIPGTMVRGNEDVKGALRRLVEDVKVHSSLLLMDFKHVTTYTYKTSRGYITHLVYILERHKDEYIWFSVSGKNGEYFSIKRLPKNIIEHHRLFLKGKL